MYRVSPNEVLSKCGGHTHTRTKCTLKQTLMYNNRRVIFMPAVQRNIGTKLFTETRVSVTIIVTTPQTRTCISHLVKYIIQNVSVSLKMPLQV